MSIEDHSLRYKRITTGRYTGHYRVWLSFPTMDADEQEIGTIFKRGSKWYGGARGLARYITGKTRGAVASNLLGHYLDHASSEINANLKHPTHYRLYKLLTPEQANAVWDVLVEGWSVRPSLRDDFVYHMTRINPPSEWRCGYGKFRNGHDSFRLSMYVEDMTPVYRWLMARCSLKLEKLYDDWFCQ